ncbi:MAG: hypothetical protein RJB66_947 [Pseudomonadota bacterium]|jgi:hypothetical protein
MNLPTISQQKSLNGFGSGDLLVLFGELFQRGYANGLVEEAENRGMTIVRSTVGRRDDKLGLRALNEEEGKNIPQPWINLPLECGFDLEPNSHGQTPVDLCKSIGLKEGIKASLNLELIEESQERGRARFRQQVKNWVKQLEPHILPGKKVLIAHLMAGGVPRSKIILSLMNRVFKGTGDRYLSSEEFWASDIGNFCQKSFLEVTAESFNILIEETASLRKHQSENSGFIHYSAYGYHGTPIFFDRKLQWFSYTPYLQGFAKRKLEEYSQQHWKQGVKSTVYNCPEILTNSSGIFPGVEIFLYSLIYEMRARAIQTPYVVNTLQAAEECLIDGGLEKVRALIESYFKNPIFIKSLNFSQWPSHSNKELMELMLKASDDLVNLHKDPNNLMTSHLSELIIKASGALMLNDIASPQEPVAWIGHDSVIKYFE